MTRYLRLTLIAALVIAGGWFLLRKGGPALMEYRSPQADLPVTFRYPVDWRMQEERGSVDTYRQVRLLGPRNHDDTYTCWIAVRGSPLKHAGGKFASLEELLRHYRTSLGSSATIERQVQRTLASVATQDLTLSYTIPPLHRPGLKPIAIPLKTRVVALQKGQMLYELEYSADAREYDQHAQIFERVLKSFRFL